MSAVYSIFDPLVFIAAYIMKATLLLQRLGWDGNRWLDDIPKLQEIQVDLCFKPKGFGEVKEVQLHLVSDASRQGYAAVTYLCLKDVNDAFTVYLSWGRQD